MLCVSRCTPFCRCGPVSPGRKRRVCVYVCVYVCVRKGMGRALNTPLVALATRLRTCVCGRFQLLGCIVAIRAPML